jgi:hypothetical protein
MKIRIREATFIRLCGYNHKNSLKGANFYLDPHFPDPGMDYQPSAKLYKITARKYANDECTQLSDLPKGHHVLTIKTQPGQKVYLTHLVEFK